MLVSLSGAIATGAMAAKGPKDVAVRHTGTDYNNGQALPIGSKKVKIGQPPLGPAKIGSVRTWLGLDDFDGGHQPQELHAPRRRATRSRSGLPTT